MLLFTLVGTVLNSLACYLGGRILFPAMGLDVPGFGTWFWVWVVIMTWYLIDRVGQQILLRIKGDE